MWQWDVPLSSGQVTGRNNTFIWLERKRTKLGQQVLSDVCCWFFFRFHVLCWYGSDYWSIFISSKYAWAYYWEKETKMSKEFELKKISGDCQEKSFLTEYEIIKFVNMSTALIVNCFTLHVFWKNKQTQGASEVAA